MNDEHPAGENQPAIAAGASRRRPLRWLVAALLKTPLRIVAAIGVAIGAPRFGLVRSRHAVRRDGWILGDRDR